MDIDAWALAFAEAMHLHLTVPPDDLTELMAWGRELHTDHKHRDPAAVALEIWQAMGDPTEPAH